MKPSRFTLICHFCGRPAQVAVAWSGETQFYRELKRASAVEKPR